MTRQAVFATTFLVGLGVANLAASDPAPAPVVIRGSAMIDPTPDADNDGPVLRGTPPAAPPARTSAATPDENTACPDGYVVQPGAGCVAPGFAYAPDEAWGLPYFAPGLQRRPHRRALFRPHHAAIWRSEAGRRGPH